ncbi:hypothetical protein H0B56_05650 [Haloechinothrix sp. YIM 98757]|uniref:Uncharacterized protein n=1 Tax=Haloechinothrix aidingensis TaxID=2752311 RepID=A0A838A8Y2_9PSEU|nr:hypothetical protein [Haloechinothrix aidingensis]MBA0125021.1 hypothetical protein [Haloechinothrix aidingensis]
MEPVRPLRDVFDELIEADPAERDVAALLRESGYSDLPDDVLSEAIVSYAETAPVEVAEHLAPFVTAHATPGSGDAAGTRPAPEHGLDLLASMPAPEQIDDTPATDPVPDIAFGTGSDDTGIDDLDFGAGDPASGVTTSAEATSGDTVEPGTPAGSATPGEPALEDAGPADDSAIIPFDDAPGTGSSAGEDAGSEGDAGT